MSITDSYGRHINYLRLSVTDRCNLRCRYCMPPQGIPKLAHTDVLTYEDLFRVARAAVALGIHKVRLTGGEPLVRKGIVEFAARVAALDGLQELVLTTNGLMLRSLAAPLREAGVKRLNISLDSLNPETFATITRGGALQDVVDGLKAAEDCGFPAPKLNVVVMRGVNDDEVVDFADLTLHKPYNVRFIEYMPTLKEDGWRSMAISGDEILARIAAKYTLTPIERTGLAGPARNYRIAGAAGKLGIISPIFNHFCDSCNRIRVTASGMAKGCLFSKTGLDLKPSLREPNDVALTEALREIVLGKPDRHNVTLANPGDNIVPMSQIGG